MKLPLKTICKFYSKQIDNVHCTLYNLNYT